MMGVTFIARKYFSPFFYYSFVFSFSFFFFLYFIFGHYFVASYLYCQLEMAGDYTVYNMGLEADEVFVTRVHHPSPRISANGTKQKEIFLVERQTNGSFPLFFFFFSFPFEKCS
jgi:hypothetical protein